MRSQVEVMAFIERTVICRVEKQLAAPRGSPTSGTYVIRKVNTRLLSTVAADDSVISKAKEERKAS